MLVWLFSSIGKKTVVALTGIALVLFVIGHMLGNLTVFLGPDAINAYAMHLRDLGPLLWLVRLVMLASVVLHIWFTMLLWKENFAAHPQKYAVFAPMTTTILARTSASQPNARSGSGAGFVPSSSGRAPHGVVRFGGARVLC